MKSSKKGISLIVLVITIIVMIILATAIILSLNSSNIVEKAKEAKTATDIANAKNVVILAKGEWELMTESERTANGGSFVTYAESKLKEVGYEDEFIVSLGVNDDGTVTLERIKIPKGFVISIYEGETRIDEGVVIYETNSLSGIDQETAMTSYNQYVWVPVPDISEFVRRDGYYYGSLQTGISDGNATEPYSKGTLSSTNDLTGEYAEYAKMKASVEKYGGFYIARYEAGTTTARADIANGTTDVLVQKNKPVYNYVAWGPSMTSASGDVTYSSKNQGKGAVELSRSIYPENSNSEVVSTLIYGVQWDAVMNFMKDIENPNVEGKKYIENSTGMGYYGGSTYINTGTNDDYMVKNIYDMAGNVYEWTMEANFSSRVLRGGFFAESGIFTPASVRNSAGSYELYRYYGFRLALYLK